MADCKDSPLVILNNYSCSEDGGPVLKALKEMACSDFNLLCVGNMNWNHDMTPWLCPPLSPKDTPCTGGADDYLQLLVSEIMPKAKKLIKSGSILYQSCRLFEKTGGLLCLIFW